MYKIDMSLVIRMKHGLQSNVSNRTMTIKEPARHCEVLSHAKLDKFVDLYVTKVKKVRFYPMLKHSILNKDIRDKRWSHNSLEIHVV